MKVARSRVTAIEIAVDVELPGSFDPSSFVFSARSEPRICLVAAFALPPQLKRIVAAVDRVLPARLPTGLRVVPAKAHPTNNSPLHAVSLEPMPALVRLQSKLIKAIEPGLAHDGVLVSFEKPREMDEMTAHFIGDFISAKTLPTFEPLRAAAHFASMRLTTTGITMYQLGRRGAPQWILGHWAYHEPASRSLHLGSGP